MTEKVTIYYNVIK